MKKPYKLTVVLLTYNRSKNGYLKASLEAILNQSYKDFELLVFDNYSTDNTSEIILSYDDPRLFYVREAPGGNPTTSYNHALWMSRGEYILFTHDDDIMESELISKYMNILENKPDILCAASNVSLMDSKGNILQEKLYDFEKNLSFKKDEFIRYYFENKIWLPTPTIIYHRDTYLKILEDDLSEKNPEYFASGDLWAVFNINLKGEIVFLAEPNLRYRQHDQQESRNVNQSKPVLDVIKNFYSYIKESKYNEELVFAIFSFLLRFKIQDILFKNPAKQSLIKEMNELIDELEKTIPECKRALDSLLPFDILCRIVFEKQVIGKQELNEIENRRAVNGNVSGFRDFRKKLSLKKNVFHNSLKNKKVALFGSMLVAYLVYLEAQKEEVQIVGCFDSSPARIGEKIFDIEIYSLDELQKHLKDIEFLVLTSESDQEQAIIKIINDKVPEIKIPILSWKELVFEN